MNGPPSRPRVLYVVYWGAAEPLGQSLVVPSVSCLAKTSDLTLVTFEKPHHLSDRATMKALQERLEGAGIRWVPQRYHKRPRVPATAFDIARGVVEAVRQRVRERFDILHARTFVGGLIGLPASMALRVPLVYHNEGFYPDEQVDGGVWREGSFPHRLALSLERQLYRRSAGIITLSHRALEQVARERGDPAVPLTVVPSTVDLEQFAPGDPAPRDGPLRLAYIGSIGLRYIFDRAARFAAVAGRQRGLALTVLTPRPADEVEAMAAAAGVAATSLTVDFVPHEEVPARLQGHHAGLFFLARGISEHGCSPTKIGEYWAMGLPVVTTPNVSDTDAIIREERVGVVVEEHSDEAYERAARQLDALLADPDLAARCRRAAERHYSLAIGCENQRRLYEAVLGRRRGR